MLTKFYKIFCLTLLLIFQSPLYSKSKDIKEFNSKNLSSYLSGLVSYDNQKNIDALKFFTLSDSLINKHDPYLKKYIFSLVMEGKINKSIKQLKQLRLHILLRLNFCGCLYYSLFECSRFSTNLRNRLND